MSGARRLPYSLTYRMQVLMISYSGGSKTGTSLAVPAPDQSSKNLHSRDLWQKEGLRVMLGIGIPYHRNYRRVIELPVC